MPTAPPKAPRQPLISILLPTRDRPRLFALALEYYRHQTWPRKELIVVDDGELFPVDPAPIEELGGRLIRVPTGAPTGTKLNKAVEASSGEWCQRMDDDDWYAPTFMETMIAGALADQAEVCRPTLAFLLPFLFFDVAHWEIRQSHSSSAPGGSMLFTRSAWEVRPFRPITIDEDVWFFYDQRRWGAEIVAVRAWKYYLAVRHRGTTGDRGHVWTHQRGGGDVENYLLDQPLHKSTPEAMLPEFALQVYRQVRREIQSAEAK